MLYAALRTSVQLASHRPGMKLCVGRALPGETAQCNRDSQAGYIVTTTNMCLPTILPDKSGKGEGSSEKLQVS